jgi:DNA-binding beta-propeller fold protein YncE
VKDNRLGMIGNPAWPTRRHFLAASLAAGGILGRGRPAWAAERAAAAGVLPQGYGPGSRSLAITRDGKTAYVAFGLSDTLLNIDLTTGEIAGAIDVAPAGFLLQSDLTGLSPDGRWLVIANNGSSNMLVVDTAAQSVS